MPMQRKSNLLERRNSISTTERKVVCPQISPALYATPKPPRLPDSPSSFSPSPYIINHKRRGPRLLKSFSEDDIALRLKDLDGGDKINENAKNAEDQVIESKFQSATSSISDSVEERKINGAHDVSSISGHMNALDGEEIGSRDGDITSIIARNGSSKESTSYTSDINGEECFAMESCVPLASTIPMGDFYDAWEELSSDSGLQPSLRDIEAELREMRLNLLMEIDKRKQAEVTLNNLQNHWHSIKEQLTLVGLTFPAFPFAFPKGKLSSNIDPAEDLYQQVYLARVVSDCIGRGVAKAEVEVEKKAQIEAKNFEIARLSDRLHYYEAANQEMSHKNQEAVEMGRRSRQVRKKKQKWIWGSIAALVSLGTAALAGIFRTCAQPALPYLLLAT
ncbi:uncharacterized protein LOC126653805 isoform X2 [Mercurialis annua]|uniref:uncharacterized protein LOC126653805 isoform X2 n=1 Tax=Mercurialis annua TaxID=3986 RepID=UPI00215FF3B7|nr:uncharacterized protein LOC126653805 isoform X2 [Mercurialis annua]